MPCSRMEGAGKPRHRSQNPRGEGESAGSDRIKALELRLDPNLYVFAAKRRNSGREIHSSSDDEQKRCSQQGYMLFATARDAAYDEKD